MVSLPENHLMTSEILKRSRERRVFLAWLIAMAFGTHVLAIFAGAIGQHAFFEPKPAAQECPAPIPPAKSQKECLQRCLIEERHRILDKLKGVTK